MTSTLAKEWNGAPLEICRHVMSFIDIIPSARKVFPIPQHMDSIRVLTDDAFVVYDNHTHAIGEFMVIGNGYEIPDNGKLLYINGGHLFVVVPSNPRTLYAIGQYETDEFEFDFDFEVVGASISTPTQVIVQSDIMIHDSALYAVLSTKYIEPEYHRVPWAISDVCNNKIAYITISDVDDIPQKVAVFAEL